MALILISNELIKEQIPDLCILICSLLDRREKKYIHISSVCFFNLSNGPLGSHKAIDCFLRQSLLSQDLPGPKSFPGSNRETH